MCGNFSAASRELERVDAEQPAGGLEAAVVDVHERAQPVEEVREVEEVAVERHSHGDDRVAANGLPGAGRDRVERDPRSRAPAG